MIDFLQMCRWLLLGQVVAIAVTVLWSVAITAIILRSVKYIGIGLRVSEIEETLGLDHITHGEVTELARTPPFPPPPPFEKGEKNQRPKTKTSRADPKRPY